MLRTRRSRRPPKLDPPPDERYERRNITAADVSRMKYFERLLPSREPGHGEHDERRCSNEFWKRTGSRISSCMPNLCFSWLRNRRRLTALVVP